MESKQSDYTENSEDSSSVKKETENIDFSIFYIYAESRRA